MLQLQPLKEGEQRTPDKMEGSPSSVLDSGDSEVLHAPRAESSGQAPGLPAGPAPAAELSSVTEDSEATVAAAPNEEEGLAQLQALGRQLLLGWAEALAALAKLPGVGSMRVEALAARLQHLAQEASPRGAAAEVAGGGEAATAAAASAPAAAGPDAGAAASRGGTPPPLPATELAGPACRPHQSYSDPVDMFATAAKSAQLPYPELLHAFAASAEGLDDEALADYLFNLAMLCAEPADNELVVRPVLSLPQHSEEQQLHRRRQAAAAATPVDAVLAAMQQQQGGGAATLGPRSASGSGGLSQDAIWQQIVAQQHAAQQAQQQQLGRLAAAAAGRGGLPLHPPARSKSDMLASYQQALAGPEQLQSLLRGASPPYGQQQFAAPPLQAPLSPTRGLQAPGSPLAKAVSMPERDLWLTAASLASEAEQKQQEAAAAAAAAAAASASFSFHPQPPSPSFARLPGLSPSGGSAGGSGLWSSSTGASSAGGNVLRSLSELSYQ